MRSAGDLLFCNSELAQRLEQAEAATTHRYVEASAALHPARGITDQTVGDGIAFYAGAGSPINRVVTLGMRHAVDHTIIETCQQFYTARCEPTRVDLCPLAHPSLLAALHREYSLAQFKHVFVRTLVGWPDTTWHEPGVIVAPVTPAEAELWAQTVAAAAHGGAPSAVGLEVAQPTPYKADTVCFLARIDGSPAGGGALAIQAGVGICYSTSVRPELRRMGVQSALLYARFGYAREQGCDLLMVQTTPGSASQRNVERFGLQIAYTKPTMKRPIPG